MRSLYVLVRPEVYSAAGESSYEWDVSADALLEEFREHLAYEDQAALEESSLEPGDHLHLHGQTFLFVLKPER